MENLALSEARDILWALTSRNVFRMLVGVRQWPIERYASWLTDALISTLLKSDG